MSITNSAPTPAPAPAAKGFLARAFNAAATFGIGAAFGLAAKTAVLAVAATATAPALAAAIAAGAVGGVATSLTRHAMQNRQLRRDGKETISYDWKRKGLLAALLGAAGGGVASFLADSDTISNTFGKLVDFIKGSPADEIAAVTPPTLPITTAPLPVEPVKPAIGACLPDDVQAVANADGASETLREAANRACSTNTRASLQATKDLAIEMLPKNQDMAVALLHKAADGGNVQAIRDLAFLEFHGKSGVEKNVEAAIEKMKTVMDQDKLAMKLAKAWGIVAEPPATAPVPAPMPVVEVPEVSPVVTVTVDADTPRPEPSIDAAEQAPAPIEERTLESAAKTTTAGNPGDCTAVFHKNLNVIDFICPVGNHDIKLGDTISITRPPLIGHMAM